MSRLKIWWKTAVKREQERRFRWNQRYNKKSLQEWFQNYLIKNLQTAVAKNKIWLKFLQRAQSGNEITVFQGERISVMDIDMGSGFTKVKTDGNIGSFHKSRIQILVHSSQAFNLFVHQTSFNFFHASNIQSFCEKIKLVMYQQNSSSLIR